MKAYKIEIEIYEGKGGNRQTDENGGVRPDIVGEGICAWMYRGDGEQSYQVGQTFSYPEDNGKLCPWLLDSMQGVIHALRFGGTLPWRYMGTPYEKVFDKDGVTTEYIRCIDPTDSGIVVKITRTEIPV